tara:strand:+ start:13608 stop:14462 length:855 start_codon:yes stop_codon:yes gene_type:complete
MAKRFEDSVHKDGDVGELFFGVRKDTAAALAADGDYIPLIVDSSGKLHVTGDASAAKQDTIIGHVDGIETLLGTIDADTNDIKTDMAAIEVLLTAANVDHAANEVLLTGIDADTNDIKTDIAALEVLVTATNSKIDTLDAVVDNVLTALQIMDDWDDGDTAKVTNAPATPVTAVLAAGSIANGANTNIINDTGGGGTEVPSGKTLYITSVIFNCVTNSVTMTLQDTGGNNLCQVVSGSSAAASPTIPVNFPTPIKVASSEDGVQLHQASTGAATCGCTVTGFYI